MPVMLTLFFEMGLPEALTDWWGRPAGVSMGMMSKANES